MNEEKGSRTRSFPICPSNANLRRKWREKS